MTSGPFMSWQLQCQGWPFLRIAYDNGEQGILVVSCHRLEAELPQHIPANLIVVQTATTNGSDSVSGSELLPGRYIVAVEHTGFQRFKNLK